MSGMRDQPPAGLAYFIYPLILSREVASLRFASTFTPHVVLHFMPARDRCQTMYATQAEWHLAYSLLPKSQVRKVSTMDRHHEKEFLYYPDCNPVSTIPYSYSTHYPALEVLASLLRHYHSCQAQDLWHMAPSAHQRSRMYSNPRELPLSQKAFLMSQT